MSEIRELYNDLITDHYQKPRNFGPLPEADHVLEGYNPLCGDRFTIALKMEDGVVRDVRFQGHGCGISTASASLMTQMVKGKSREEVEALFQKFHDFITGALDAAQVPELGKLVAFSGVPKFPVRVKCATLPWHTLRAALEGNANPVSTE
jgi:nitrogen fixation NifU-like protein